MSYMGHAEVLQSLIHGLSMYVSWVFSFRLAVCHLGLSLYIFCRLAAFFICVCHLMLQLPFHIIINVSVFMVCVCIFCYLAVFFSCISSASLFIPACSFLV